MTGPESRRRFRRRARARGRAAAEAQAALEDGQRAGAGVGDELAEAARRAEVRARRPRHGGAGVDGEVDGAGERRGDQDQADDAEPDGAAHAPLVQRDLDDERADDFDEVVLELLRRSCGASPSRRPPSCARSARLAWQASRSASARDPDLGSPDGPVELGDLVAECGDLGARGGELGAGGCEVLLQVGGEDVAGVDEAAGGVGEVQVALGARQEQGADDGGDAGEAAAADEDR
jgi:hypothetical protein